MKQKPILIDLDETVYPFLNTWDTWLKTHTHAGGVDYDAFVWWYDLDLYLAKHLERIPDFIKAQPDLRPKPIPEAITALTLISETYPIMALTARNKADWSAETDYWVSKHLPFVTDVHYTRSNNGADAVPKAKIAKQLKAQALIDDTAYWIEGLPSTIDGYVVERPYPLASDAGAMPWTTISELILNK